MEESEFECPICHASMVRREGPKISFYGCSNYRINQCPGKRTLDGTPFGCDGETPAGLGSDAERWFDAGIAEGMDYDEASEMAFDWQRQEENDRF